MDEQIREVITRYGKLGVEVSALGEDDDLYQAGMTSHASVNVMLGLESAFDVEFPDHMLARQVFESIAAMREALAELLATAST
jgi:acyl carrier protein